MSRKFKLYKDYYDEGYDIYKKKTITIKPGVTVLVGCNGIGKTILLHQIRDGLKKEKIPCISFDNLKDGGRTLFQRQVFMETLILWQTQCVHQRERTLYLM